MPGSHLVHICDINGNVFKYYLEMSDFFDSMSEQVASCQGLSCLFEPCQDMLKHVGAMSVVPADVRECWEDGVV